VDLGRDGFELLSGVGKEAEVYFLDDLRAESASATLLTKPSQVVRWK
jgi:hypothetical protein